jgi:glycerate kinase
VDVAYGWQSATKTAFVEMAQASGLPRLTQAERNPLQATSYGTGQVLAHAIHQGAQSIVLGLGGSATNDGGMGALRALGFEFQNGSDEAIKTPDGLFELEKVTFLPGLVSSVERLQSLDWLVACDVENRLLGAEGATAVFGPQKGVTAQSHPVLESGLARLAQVLTHQWGVEVESLAGGGAAGGMAAGLVGVLSARLIPGFDLLADRLGLADSLMSHPIKGVITGEGQLDAQSLKGKLPVAMAKLAAQQNVPTFALCGRLEDAEILGQYFKGVHTINANAPQNESLQEAMSQTPGRLQCQLHALWPSWLHSLQSV